jgi:hypothetical protein
MATEKSLGMGMGMGMGGGGMGMGGGGMGMGMTMSNPTPPCCMMRNLRGEAPIDFEELEAPPLPKTYSYNPSLVNVEWESFDRLEQFSNALQCGNLPSDRPIHGVDTWHQLRQTYEDVVGPQRSSISRVLSNVEAKGEQMPVAAQDSNSLSVEHVPGKGRGLVAAKDIKKGEKMWSDVHMGKCVQYIVCLHLLRIFLYTPPHTFSFATNVSLSCTQLNSMIATI